MKILFGVHHFPPKFNGGAEWRAFRTAKGMAQSGVDVRVICVENPNEDCPAGIYWKDDVYEDIPVRRMFYNRKLAPDEDRFEYDNLWIGDALERLIGEWRPDIFHLVGGYLMSGKSILAAKKHNIATCLSVTDFWFFCMRITKLRSDGSVCDFPESPHRCVRCQAEVKRRYRIPAQIVPWLMDLFWKLRYGQNRAYERRNAFLLETLQKIDLIISPSVFLRSVYLQAGLPEDKVVFCRQGRDFTGLTPDQLGKTPSNRLRIGYAGQIAWHKGVHLIAEALAEIPAAPVEVQVYGNQQVFPKYTQHLTAMSQRDPRFQLRGQFKNPEDLLEIFRNFDVLVVPSLWYENSPNVIIEAFAHRTPVITSQAGGMGEMVRDGVDGLHFAHGNAQDLSRKIALLASDSALLARLRSGIEPVKNFAAEMDEMMGYYQSILKPVKAP